MNNGSAKGGERRGDPDRPCGGLGKVRRGRGLLCLWAGQREERPRPPRAFLRPPRTALPPAGRPARGSPARLFTGTVCPPGFPYDKVVQRVLYLQVLDYDRFSRNDPIGEVSIPLNKVDLTQMQTFWKELKPCSDGSVRPLAGGWGVRAGRSSPSPPSTWGRSGVLWGWGADGWPPCSRVPTSGLSAGAWHLGGLT